MAIRAGVPGDNLATDSLIMRSQASQVDVGRSVGDDYFGEATYPANAGSAAAGSSFVGASHSFPHLRHFRKSPRALVNFISAPT